MRRNVCWTFMVCLLTPLWSAFVQAENQSTQDPPAVAYNEGLTWAQTVRAMRRALSAYQDTFVFSATQIPAGANTVPIDVDIRDAQYLWLISNHQDRSVWCSPQLISEDGTGVSLSTLIPFSQEAGKNGLQVNTVALDGQDYPRSLVVPGTSKVGYKLNGRYTRFQARVGLARPSRKGQVNFLVCTAPVYKVPNQCAHRLFACIDVDFPEHAQTLGPFQPVREIGQIEDALARIEARVLSNRPLPLQRLQARGDRARVLAARMDQYLGWPDVRRDNQRSGISHEQLQVPLLSRWVHTPDFAPRPAWPPPAKTNRAVQSPPLDPTLTYDRAFHTVVHGGRVYYGSSVDDSVHCLDLETGEALWTFTTNGPVRLAPALYAGRCYAGSDDGHLYCIDGKTGALLWTFRAGPEGPWIPGNGRIISSFPVRCGICVDQDTVYFAAGLFPRQGTFLCALNAQTGQEVFVRPLTCSPQGYMLLMPTRILVPTGRTPFVMFDRQTGKSLRQLGHSDAWGQDLKGGSFAVVIEDRIATGPSEDGHIHLFNAKRPESIFRSAGQQIMISGPTAYILRKDSLFAIDRRKYLLEQQESLKWRTPCDQSYCMIMAGNTIFCGTDGAVYAINAQTGARVWTTAVEGRAEGLAVSQGHLLISTSSGKIYCFTGTPSTPLPAHRVLAHSEIPIDGPTAQLAAKPVCLAKVKKGYCLLQGLGNVQLAAQLAKLSDLRIVCAETDKSLVDRMRVQLRAAGLYGDRVVCHHWPDTVTPYQHYLFNAMVINADHVQVLSETHWQSIHAQLRPHGGLLAVLYQDRTQVPAPGPADEWESADVQGTHLVYQYRPALAGEGTWTHPYADPGNSACSQDQFAFTNTTVQWFGPPGPRDIVDRHRQSPPPVYTRGRVFITGSDYLAAVDAYNGTVLWEKRLAESGRVKTLYNGCTCGYSIQTSLALSPEPVAKPQFVSPGK